MKATARSQRRRQHQSGPSISLFPFLAVLICTMGALVPLLLAITRTARLQAEAAALAKVSEQGTETQAEREMVQWRIGQLKNSRRQTESQLADARLQLGHLEEHSMRLRDQLARYEQTVGDLEQLGSADGRQRAASQAELEQVRGQIAAAQRQLAETREAAAQRNHSYSVVPYEGPNQTRRRPIYLECRADTVVLQPEGIELTEADFEGPLGSGNPLAAALRAVREYLLRQRDFDPNVGEPYPLLLVRPEGINAFYAARAAMKSWGSDFGYELIDKDWKLAYQPPDSRLADVVRQVVESARVSQARLAAAAPRHYGSRSKVVYRAAPGGGGFVAEGGSSQGNGPGYRPHAPAGPVGRGYAAGGGEGGYGGSGDVERTGTAPPGMVAAQSQRPGAAMPGSVMDYSERPGTAVPGGGAAGGQATVGPGGGGYGAGDVGGPAFPENGPGGTGIYGVPGGGDGTIADAGPQDGNVLRSGTAATGTMRAESQSSGTAAQGGVGGQAMLGAAYPHSNPLPTNLRSVPGEGTTRPDGYIAGQPPREQVVAKEPQAGAVQGRIHRPGEWEPTPDLPPEKPKDKEEHKDKEHRKNVKSLAEKRGQDWGLRNAAHNSVGVTRPIRIECYADRLVVISERGATHNKVIAIGARTETSVDPLISAAWDHMEAWGMAGRGMYWRPVLQMYVAPDAEPRFQELAALLEGSGLSVVRR